MDTTYRSGSELCDARKDDVGSQSATPLNSVLEAQQWPVLKRRVAKRNGPSSAEAEAVGDVSVGRIDTRINALVPKQVPHVVPSKRRRPDSRNSCFSVER
jgi:hypothetical protein